MKKEYPIVMLPTEKLSNQVGAIVMRPSDKRLATINVLTVDDTQECVGQHFYILSDSEIKEGDWYIDDSNQIRKSIISNKEYWHARNNYGKIIATTDPSLKLPSISDSFIKEYIKAYNEGKKIETVELEHETGYPPFDNDKGLKLNPDGSVIASLKEENNGVPNFVNEIQELHDKHGYFQGDNWTVLQRLIEAYKEEKMYTRDEVSDKIQNFFLMLHKEGYIPIIKGAELRDKWISDNL